MRISYCALPSKKLQCTFASQLRPNLRECFRLNFWPNTPEILPAYLRIARRAAFVVRLILAATLGVSYWIYTPASVESRAAVFLTLPLLSAVVFRPLDVVSECK